MAADHYSLRLTSPKQKVIAINQDPLCKAGYRLAGNDLAKGAVSNVWGRQLSNGFAMAFFNNGASPANITCDQQCWSLTNLGNTTVSVRDVWSHNVIGRVSGSLTASNVAANGGTALFKLTKI